MTTPVLTTENLKLRGHTLADFDARLALWTDPDVTRYIGKPSTAQETWFRLLRHAGMWALLGFGSWLVETRDDHRFVGEIGLADFHREMGDDFASPEMGWVLAPWAHGRGWASEAVAAALAWSDANLPERRTVCMIASENAPSIRVAERAGYTPLRTAVFRDSPALLFERVR